MMREVSMAKLNRLIQLSGFTFLLVLAGSRGGPPCLGAEQGSDVLDFKALAKNFWDVREVRKAGEKEPTRFAIVEFTVEFVGKGPSGKAADFPAGMKLELPGVLYEGFVQLLPEFDIIPSAHSDVSESQAYKRLSGKSVTDPVFLSRKAKEGQTIRYPVDGLLAIEGKQDEVDSVLKDLLKEIGAQRALQVHLRVGIRDGRAAIEKGSIFRTVGPGGVSLLKSRQTMIGAASVVDRGVDKGQEDCWVIDSDRFERSLQRMFRPAISMAIIAAENTE